MNDESGGATTLGLDEFLRMLPFLESGELLAISAAYRDGDEVAREAARMTASGIASKRGLVDELRELEGSIIQWAGSITPRNTAMIIFAARPDQILSDLRAQAVPPLLDAAMALFLKDALPDELRELLLEPVRAATG